MSGSYAEVLWRRARAFLEAAGLVEDPDLAAFLAEQAMQLAVKAAIYELFGERVRGHGIRELLSILARRLEEAGYRREADTVREFVAEHRGLLVEAEEAYILARYGEHGYDRGVAGRLVELAERLVSMLRGVVDAAKLG